MINLNIILILLTIILKLNFNIILILAVFLLVCVSYNIYLLMKTIIISFIILLLLGGGLFFLLSYLILISKISNLKLNKALGLLIFFIFLLAWDYRSINIVLISQYCTVWLFNNKFILLSILLVFLMLYFIIIINLFLDTKIRAIRSYL